MIERPSDEEIRMDAETLLMYCENDENYKWLKRIKHLRVTNGNSSDDGLECIKLVEELSFAIDVDDVETMLERLTFDMRKMFAEARKSVTEKNVDGEALPDGQLSMFDFMKS